MKNLLLLALLGVLGYFAYLQWEPDPEPPPEIITPQPVAKADFFVKSRVRSLFEEWQRRAVTKGLSGGPEDGTKGSTPNTLVDMSREIEQIRRILFTKNVFAAEAMTAQMKLALRDLGVVPSEIDEVYSGIIAEASNDQKLQGRQEQKEY
jgi:hypothetical protein